MCRIPGIGSGTRGSSGRRCRTACRGLGGIACGSRRLHASSWPGRPAAGSRYFLEFDGVGTIADVWLNGHYLGKHAGAFSRFRFDATAAIDPSGDNVLVVKADNSKPQPGSSTAAVIPLSGDFFVFGGIYRSVALVVTHAAHVDLLDYGGPGVYAHAVSIEPCGGGRAGCDPGSERWAEALRKS
jgi:hypothetical protein